MAINISPKRFVSVGNGLKIGFKDVPDTSVGGNRKKKELVDALGQLKDDYLDDTVGITKDTSMVNLKALSDSDGKEIAERIYADYYDDKRRDKEHSYDEKEINYRNKLDSEKVKRAESVSKARDAYNADRAQAINSAMEKGIQRSSIVGGRLKSFDDVLENAIALIDENYGKNVSDINEKIDSLKDKMSADLNEIDDNEREAIKKKIAEYEKIKQKIKKGDYYYEDYDKQAYEDYRINVIKEVYKYLSNFPKDYALYLLNNDKVIKSYLGNDYGLVLNFLDNKKD